MKPHTDTGISYAVLYLASDESRFVTGLQLPVEAGARMKGTGTRKMKLAGQVAIITGDTGGIPDDRATSVHPGIAVVRR